MPQQVTFIFGAGKNGWSESWYMQKASLEAALSAAQVLYTPRALLLGQGSVIEAIRVSDVDVDGDSLVQFYRTDTIQGQLGARDVPSNAMYIRVTSGANFRRQMYLRGLPDDWIVYNPVNAQYVYEDRLTEFLNVWGDSARTAGLSMRTTPKAAGLFNWKPITTVVRNIDNTWTFGCPTHGFIVTELVQISSLKTPALKKLRGRRVVSAVTADTFTVASKPTDPVEPFVYQGGGFARRVGVQYSLITNFQIVRPAAKKTGKAFFVSAGRRRAR